MLEGAVGCALGSHVCKGIIPAFVPKPIRAKINTIFFISIGIFKEEAFMSEKLILPL
jgi:hypothetical protein